LSPHTWVAGETREAGAYKDALLHHMQKTEVDLTVLLGEVTVDFEELLHLQVGDVMVLNNTVNRPIPMMVGETKKYFCQPGIAGSYMAVQITSVTDRVAEMEIATNE
jgi:flagellar motor switch protein FliM